VGGKNWGYGRERDSCLCFALKHTKEQREERHLDLFPVGTAVQRPEGAGDTADKDLANLSGGTVGYQKYTQGKIRREIKGGE